MNEVSPLGLCPSGASIFETFAVFNLTRSNGHCPKELCLQEVLSSTADVLRLLFFFACQTCTWRGGVPTEQPNVDIANSLSGERRGK